MTRTIRLWMLSAAVGASWPHAAIAQTAPAATPKLLNPDISLVGNFVAVAGGNPIRAEPALSLSEVEAAFQAVVDAYARADFYIALSPEGAEVEEGYITFTALPATLLLKAGKMRAPFGKLNTLHTHRLPAVDRSVVTDNLLGGDEGWSDAGVSLSYLVPTAALFLEVTGEVYNGDSELFHTSARSRLAYLGRVRAYRDLTEDKNVDLGVSFGRGPTDVIDADAPPIALDKTLIGVDATFRYRPLDRAIYRRLNLRTELIWSRQQRLDGGQARAFGFYALGEYQFARRWYLGARADRSGRTFDAEAIDSGGAVFLTFWPTEFSQLRTQYHHIRYAEAVSGREVLLQFNVSLGALGAHVF